MGGWKLEVARISFYLMFPISVWWAVNRPELFEGYIIRKNKEMYLPRDPKAEEEFRRAMENVELQRQLKMEEEYQKNKSS